MSLWDTYKAGAQVAIRYVEDQTPAVRQPRPLQAGAPARVGDTLGKHKALIAALGLGLVAVVVLTRQKPAPAPRATAPEPRGHLRDAGQTWRGLV